MKNAKGRYELQWFITLKEVANLLDMNLGWEANSTPPLQAMDSNDYA